MTDNALLSEAISLLRQIQGQLQINNGVTDTNWQPGDALRLRHNGQHINLHRVAEPALIDPSDLLGIERQKHRLQRNTQHFIEGKPCNHALLWGARGTGKSSLVRAIWSQYRDQGLTLVETDKQGLTALPELIEGLQRQEERLLVYCDDLSFEDNDPSYKPLKSALDGSISAPGERVLIYATSNRRHLLPEYHQDNDASQLVDGELHHGEAVEEKVSLSDRFGLWLSFHPINQQQYLQIVAHWLQRFGISSNKDSESAALRWALTRGGRSGRVAWQFARNWAAEHS